MDNFMADPSVSHGQDRVEEPSGPDRLGAEPKRPTRPRTRVGAEPSGPDGQDRLQDRLDWRTCKRHEAELIEYYHDLVLDQLEDTKEDWASWNGAYEEVDGWTLYGRRWLMYAHNWLVVAPGRPPLIPPKDGMYQDNCWKWYSHQIQWMNG